MKDFLSILIVVLGVTCFWWKNKRQFERTNDYGEERFSSYWSKVKAKFVDEVLRYSGLGLIFSGALIIIFKYAEDWVWLLVMLFLALAVENIYYGDRRKMGNVKVTSR